MSDYKGAARMLEALPKAKTLLADKGYDLVQGRNAFTDTGAALMADPEVRRTFLGG